MASLNKHTLVKSPIFIHSLFRAGSTYLFNCFRRSTANYWCYQEPLNEFLLVTVNKPEALLEPPESNSVHLRHPKIDRPYFYEFFPLAQEISRVFQKEFPYRSYFNGGHYQKLVDYFLLLIEGAAGRPVFQECRSSGRVLPLKRYIGGTHIFLWRNPWDQWWSYKVDSHFEICNLQILSADPVPPVFMALRAILDVEPETEVKDLIPQRLDSTGSYMLFYSLWLHAMLEAMPECNISINIDQLSNCEAYRSKLLKELQSRDIVGLDFSDCSSPISTYSEDEHAYFEKIESEVHNLFIQHGYNETAIDQVKATRCSCDPHRLKQSKLDSKHGVTELSRFRKTSLRLESELASAQRRFKKQSNDLLKTEENYHSLLLELEHSKATNESITASINQLEAEKTSLQCTIKSQEHAISKILKDDEFRQEALSKKLEQSEVKNAYLTETLKMLQAENIELQDTSKKQENTISEILKSKEWRLATKIQRLQALLKLR